MTKSETTTSVATLLHQAAETHHSVFAISNGEDSDWATWYSDWLVNLSALPQLLGTRPARSELTYLLVGLDKEYVATGPTMAWEDFYAQRIVESFVPAA